MVAESTILIVDDAPENIQVLAGCLQSSYRLKVATNGARCLELACSDPLPDLILLDIVMPDMDGYTVLERLKSRPETTDIPVIFVTGKTEGHEEERGLELGAVDYIHKPIRAGIVNARVNTHVTLKLQRDRLANMAMFDQLTAVYNRHYLVEAACQKIARSLRHRKPLSLLMLDIDHFKHINDQHGHAAGDEVLVSIARHLQSASRKEDIVARFGGEEFIVLLDSCDHNEAMGKAEQFRRGIEALTPRGLTVTASFGMATLDPDGEDFETLVGRADQALYDAKADGRNRVARIAVRS